jgi:hypothetical protein
MDDRIERMCDGVEGMSDGDKESVFDMSGRPFSGTGAGGRACLF